MSFFKGLSQIMDGVTLNLTVVKKDSELTVLVLPVSNECHNDTKPADKNDKTEKKNINKPMSIKGSPEELDKEFFISVGELIKETSGLIVKTEDYKNSLVKKTEELENKVAGKKKVTKTKSKADDDNDSGEDLFSSEEAEGTEENTDEENKGDEENNEEENKDQESEAE